MPDQHRKPEAPTRSKLGANIMDQEPHRGQGENLIFLISQPRAGSTMLQKILGSHPKIHTVSEPWISLPPMFYLRERGIKAIYDCDLSYTAIKDFLRTLPEKDDAYWEAVRRMLNHLYGRSLSQSRKIIFLDKTPRYYFIIPELRRVFPLARFIFLLRNPLAVFASMLKNWVRSENIWQLRGLRHDLLEAPSLLLEGIGAFGREAIVVRYEEVVSEPEATIQRLSNQLGIAFEPAMIEFGSAVKNERWQFGDQETVYKEPRPSAKYAEQWRTDLERMPIWEGWARSYLDALGPELIGNLGYDYAQLSAGLRAPGSKDWKVVAQPDAEAETVLRAELERATANIHQQSQRAEVLVAAANELVAEARVKESAIAEIAAEAEQRRLELVQAVRGIEEREERIAALEAAAAERLAALVEGEAALKGITAEAERRQEALLEAVQGIEERDKRIGDLEATAAERLEALVTKEAAIAEIAGEAERRRKALVKAVRGIEEREERLDALEATAATLQRDELILCLHAIRHSNGGTVDNTGNTPTPDRPAE